MPVQILLIEEDETFGIQIRIPSGASGLLNVVFQRGRNIVVNDQADVGLVDAHAEGVRRRHDPHPVGEEGILVPDFGFGVHLPVVGQGGKAVPGETVRQMFGRRRARDVDDGRDAARFDERAKLDVFFSVVLAVTHRVSQVPALSARREEIERDAELLGEIVSDVLNDLLLGGGRKAGDRNASAARKLFKFGDEVADVEVVDAEVVAPGGEAVRLVDHEAGDAAHAENTLDRA